MALVGAALGAVAAGHRPPLRQGRRVRQLLDILLAACLLALVGTASLARAQGGSTVIHDIESAAIADNQMGIAALRRVLVYLPRGYADTRRSYPVLYWIPGWETPASREYVAGLDAAIDKRWIPEAIVVIVDVREGLVLLNSTVFGRWEEFVTDEVIPLIGGEYRTIPDARGRAIMGHSTGGYGALMLSLLHPGVWSAVGLNDASVWAGCTVPWQEFPDDMQSVPEASGYLRAWMQVAIAIAPNPEAPLLFDMPTEGEDGWISDPRWKPYCLLRADVLDMYRETLLGMSTIQVLVPRRGGPTNAMPNVTMWHGMTSLGVRGAFTEMPGTHGGDRVNRLVLLARRILPKLADAFPDVRAQTTTWGRIKRRLGDGTP